MVSARDARIGAAEAEIVAHARVIADCNRELDALDRRERELRALRHSHRASLDDATRRMQALEQEADGGE